MTAFFAIVVLGFFLGVRHATDPDHVIAVTTIVARQRSVGYATVIGALWGLGHTLTILVVGAAIIFCDVVIPPRIALTMELSVGVMLILLGVLNLTGALKWRDKFTPSHMDHAGHVHDDEVAELCISHHKESGDPMRDEFHSTEASTRLARALGRFGAYQLIRPVAVGIVHGLAGSAAVALLVLATIRNPWWAAGYLLVFGVGTIAGMMLITTAIAMPLALTSSRFSRLNRTLVLASGALSACFGLFICYQIGLVDGLFTSHPHWTPH